MSGYNQLADDQSLLDWAEFLWAGEGKVPQSFIGTVKNLRRQARLEGLEAAAETTEKNESNRWASVGDPRTPYFTPHYATAIRQIDPDEIKA